MGARSWISAISIYGHLSHAQGTTVSQLGPWRSGGVTPSFGIPWLTMFFWLGLSFPACQAGITPTVSGSRLLRGGSKMMNGSQNVKSRQPLCPTQRKQYRLIVKNTFSG